MDQWNSTGSPEINPCTDGQATSDKRAKTTWGGGGGTVFSINSLGKLDIYMQKKETVLLSEYHAQKLT